MGKLVNRLVDRAGRESLGDVGGALVRSAMLVIGFILAVTIIVPSITPGDLIGSLGVSSVAIGFAFKDIPQTCWLAS